MGEKADRTAEALTLFLHAPREALVASLDLLERLRDEAESEGENFCGYQWKDLPADVTNGNASTWYEAVGRDAVWALAALNEGPWDRGRVPGSALHQAAETACSAAGVELVSLGDHFTWRPLPVPPPEGP